eukprot:TRINITY_DN22092_c0_g1_i1.p1 TRINITY_DN22092_c0_g1~~TRINITY_DN22092_c0_g1_i1.p1  ORF type:complete len:258 (-),score=91.66 TRINITY_DN22092_c0_g1_i1:144-917(-)
MLLIDGFFFFFKQKTAYEMLRSLVGSEMCIRDRYQRRVRGRNEGTMPSMRGPNKPTFNKQLLLVPLAFLALILFYNSLGAAPSPQLHGRDFAVVFDAGSSGSRVHVFQFIELANGQHELEQEYFKQLKPGLSSYKTDAVAAADSLTPLLEYAVEKVPSAQHGITPIIVRATAGLRMLPGEQAERILNAVAQKLQGYDFKLQGPDEDVKIMDGEDEGIYAWLSVNYLLKRVGKTAEHTVSTIDPVSYTHLTLPTKRIV